jgi:NifU-like protein involved in Fe-S cluster formation
VATGVNQPLYTVEILRLAASIPHLRSLPNAQGRSEVRSPTCGSSVKIEVALDDQHRVAELGQQVEACAFGQASAALLGMQAVGRSADEVEQALADLSAWLDGARDEPGDWPGLVQLAPARARRGRHGAILLPFRALLAAIHAAEAKAK